MRLIGPNCLCPTTGLTAVFAQPLPTPEMSLLSVNAASCAPPFWIGAGKNSSASAPCFGRLYVGFWDRAPFSGAGSSAEQNRSSLLKPEGWTAAKAAASFKGSE